MKMCAFLWENSLAFLRHHKKTSVLIILSLTASLLPLCMAIVNIQVMGEFMPSMRIHDAENVRILSTTDEDEAMAIYNACQYPVSLKKQSHTDIIFNDSWLSIRVVYLDDAIENYENFTIKDSLPAKDRDPSYPACTIENNLFKIYRWRVGELLKIDGREYQITTIVRSIYNLQSILLPASDLAEGTSMENYELYVHASDAPTEVQVSASPTLTMKNAADVTNFEIEDGILTSINLLLLGSALLLLSITNISMIFIGEFEGTRESIGIRRLLGAEMRHIRKIVEMKNLILIGISDVIVYILTPLLLRFTTIDTHYSPVTILVHALFSFLVGHILTLIVVGRMRKNTLIAFLKKEN